MAEFEQHVFVCTNERAQLCMELFEGRLRGCRCVFITDGIKYGYMSFLSC